jgi:hypothetical protein
MTKSRARLRDYVSPAGDRTLCNWAAALSKSNRLWCPPTYRAAAISIMVPGQLRTLNARPSLGRWRTGALLARPSASPPNPLPVDGSHLRASSVMILRTKPMLVARYEGR